MEQDINKSNSFALIGRWIGEIVNDKNKKYGNSHYKAKDFLELLYPSGVPVEHYYRMLTLVRVFDKIMRIATNKDTGPKSETPFADIAGYAILAIANNESEYNKLVTEHGKVVNLPKELNDEEL